MTSYEDIINILNNTCIAPPSKSKNKIPNQKDKHLKINTLSILNLLQSKGLQKNKIIQFPQMNSSKKVGRKTFAKLYFTDPNLKNNLECTVLIDQGADASIINYEYLKKITCNENKLSIIPTNVVSIAGFTNHTLKVIGQILIEATFSTSIRPILIHFYVVTGELYFPLLFGDENFRKMLMGINYNKVGNDEIPEVTIKFPQHFTIPTVYCHIEKLSQATGTIYLKKDERKFCSIFLHKNNIFQIGEEILISDCFNNQIHMVPTKNVIGNFKNKLEVTVYVYNPGEKEIKITATFHCESIGNNFETISPFDEKCKDLKILNNIDFKNTKINYFNQTGVNNVNVKTDLYCNNVITNDLNEMDATKDLCVDEDFYPPTQSPNYDSNFGHYIQEFETIENLLTLENYPEIIRPYLDDIFLKKYRAVISRSQYDIGNLSKTLGTYKLQLKPGCVLPAFKRLYYVTGHERKHLEDILDFLCKYNIITRSSHRDPSNEFASPAYIVPTKNPQKPGRLIIDFRILNDVIKTTPPTLPDTQTILHSLRDCILYTCTDLSAAFYSMTLEQGSKYLTKFASCTGTYYFNRLPMGAKSSPAIFNEVGNKMLHYEPVLDDNGNFQYEEDKTIKMVHRPIENVYLFFDDILIASKPYKTYKETIKMHFEKVEQVIKRLHTHSAKLSIEKTTFAATKLLYLGWIICNNKISVDPKRIKNLINSEIPTTKKGIRSFLGLLNTVRTVLSGDILKEVYILSPLTSTAKTFKMEKHHIEAFKSIKVKLCTSPNFSNMLDPNAKKVIFSDASNGKNASYSGVLCQINKKLPTSIYVPEYLDLNNPIDQFIYDQNLDYVPVSINEHPSINITEKSVLDNHYINENLLGYTDNNVHDSLFISIGSIQKAYNCQVTPLLEMRKEVISELKKKISGLKIKHFQFTHSNENYKAFLQEIEKTNSPLDKNNFMLETISSILKRKVIFLRCIKNQISVETKGEDYTNPPFIIGIHKNNDDISIFRPYFIDKNSEYDLKKFDNRLEIISFFSKSIPETDLNKTIFELEVAGLIHTLDNFKKLIGHSETTALVDNKSLFLIFCQSLRQNSPKLSRWCNYLRENFPHVQLKFIRTNHNLADFLTRDFNVSTRELKRIPLKNFHAPGLGKYLENKLFTMEDFYNFVQNNEKKFLKISDPNEIKEKIIQINNVIKDIETVIKPLLAIQAKMSHDNIKTEQHSEFKNIFENCLGNQNFKFYDKNKKLYYVLHNGLLFIETSGEKLMKLLLPKTLEYVFISYHHVASAHGGYKKMMNILDNYYFDTMATKIKKFTSACYSCFLINSNTYKHVLGSYPLTNYCMERVQFDLIENLPPSNKYNHILIGVCALSDFTLAFPLKTKTAEAVCNAFLYSIFPYFNIKIIITDGGPAFNTNFKELIKSLGISKVEIARFKPTSNGLSEAKVKTVKSILRKILVSSPNFRWHQKLPLLIKMLNSSISNKTGFSPFHMLYGKTENAKSIFSVQDFEEKELPTTVKLNFERQTEDTQNAIKIARELIISNKIEINAKLNKTRKNLDFNVGDYVFVLNRQIVVGVNPSLKPRFSTDIWTVLKINFSTLLLCRLADSFQSIYAKTDVKKFSGHAPNIELPSELKSILSIDLKDWDESNFETIRRFSKFDPPNKALTINQNDRDGDDLLEKDDVPFEIEDEIEKEFIEKPKIFNPIPDIKKQKRIKTRSHEEIISSDSDDEIEKRVGFTL